jgi:hypothetical protein
MVKVLHTNTGRGTSVYEYCGSLFGADISRLRASASHTCLEGRAPSRPRRSDHLPHRGVIPNRGHDRAWPSIPHRFRRGRPPNIRLRPSGRPNVTDLDQLSPAATARRPPPTIRRRVRARQMRSRFHASSSSFVQSNTALDHKFGDVFSGRFALRQVHPPPKAHARLVAFKCLAEPHCLSMLTPFPCLSQAAHRRVTPHNAHDSRATTSENQSQACPTAMAGETDGSFALPLQMRRHFISPEQVLLSFPSADQRCPIARHQH